jgi:hypothetical protein
VQVQNRFLPHLQKQHLRQMKKFLSKFALQTLDKHTLT